MSEAATTARVNRDWEERDFVEMMQLNVLKITEFLNRFDTSTRYRLAKLDEKLAKLTTEYEDLLRTAQLSAQQRGMVERKLVEVLQPPAVASKARSR